jgi:hypothetical protein
MFIAKDIHVNYRPRRGRIFVAQMVHMLSIKLMHQIFRFLSASFEISIGEGKTCTKSSLFGKVCLPASQEFGERCLDKIESLSKLFRQAPIITY